MLILLLEGILLIFVVRLLDKSWRPMVWRTLLGVALWTISWLSLVQLELASISSDGTYGSDAQYYYEAMRATLFNGAWWPSADTSSPGYVAFGTLVLRTSPGDSVIWVKLANIGLLIMSLVFGFYILQYWNISKKIACYAMMLAGINGIITWMAVRNLKDTLFLFLTLALNVGIKILLSQKRYTFALLKFLGMVILGFVGAQLLKFIRPWGHYWALIVLVSTIIESFFGQKLESKFKIHKILAISLALVILFVFSYHAAVQDFLLLLNYSEMSGGLIGSGLIDIVLAIPRFLTGPGPFRAILGWEVFLVTTTIGNILILLGSIMWWIYLPVLVLSFLEGPNYWFKYSSILIPLFVFLAFYSFVYSGSLETRFRAIVYGLSFIGTAPYLQKWRRKPGGLLAYVGISSIIWIGGTIASYISLVR